jgi:Uma2 family endonuclease
VFENAIENAIQNTGLGKVRMAPLDAELSYNNIVQPDVLVVLNEHLDRNTGTRFIGAPDLVVEIASPSTSRYDLHAKLNAYAQAGVPEYRVVNPDARVVELLVLENGTHTSSGLFFGSSVLPSKIAFNMTTSIEQFFVDMQ